MTEQTDELWQLNGGWWKIPIEVRHREGSSRIGITEIPLLHCQFNAVHQLLVATGASFHPAPQHSGAPDHFWIATDLLQICATKITKRDPETVLVWNPPESTEELNKLGDDANAFARSYIAAGCPFEEHMVLGTWHGMCKWAMHTLINLQRPVHMGFCILRPSMLRANWKDAVFAKMAYKLSEEDGAIIPAIDTIKRVQSQIARGELLATELIAERQRFKGGEPTKRFPLWSIEVERCECFTVQSRMSEESKFKQYGKINYWKYVLQTLKNQTPMALRCFAQWLREASLKSVALPYQYMQSSDAGKWLVIGRSAGEEFSKDAKRYGFVWIKNKWAEQVAALFENESQEKTSTNLAVSKQCKAGTQSEAGTQGNAVSEDCLGCETGFSNDSGIPISASVEADSESTISPLQEEVRDV